MVDAGIVRKVIDSIEDKKDYIQIVMGILGAIKYDVYANIKIEITIDDNSVTINDKNIGYKIDTQKSVYLIASDLFYHVTQLISGNAIENVTITDTNMFETIKEDLTDDVKKVVNNYDPHKILGDQVPPVSQQSMQVPSFIPRDDKQLFIGRVCELMNKYGDELPIKEHKGFKNLGNKSCINTGMQCLNACPEFVAWLMFLKDNTPQTDKDTKLIENLIHVFDVMRGGNITLDDNEIKTIQGYIEFPPESTYSGYDFIVGVVDRLKKITITNNTTTISSIIFNLRDSKHNNSQFIEKEIKMESILNSIVNSYNDFSFDLTKNMSSPSCIIMFELQDDSTNKNKTDLGSMRTRLIENVTLKIGEDDNEYNYDYELVAMSMFNPSIGECGLAYAKHDNKWWEFNDDHVKSIDTFESINGTLFPSTLFYRLKYSCPPPISQQSTHQPSSIPVAQKSSQQTNTSRSQEAKQQNDQSSQAPFIGQVCELMKQYGDKLPIRDTPKGLAQLGNTCYLNTGMQCLNACPIFFAWVLYLQNNSVDNEIVNNVIHLIKVMRGIEKIDKDTIINIQDELGLTQGDQNCSANFVMDLIKKIEGKDTINSSSKQIEDTTTSNSILLIVQGNFYLLQNGYTISNIVVSSALTDISNVIQYPLIIMFNINDPKSYEDNSIINLEYFKGIQIETLQYVDYRYDLVAMSMHSGSGNAGHYVAYAKHDNKWWCFDDNTVTPIEIKNNDLLQSLIDRSLNFIPTVFFYSLNCTSLESISV